MVSSSLLGGFIVTFNSIKDNDRMDSAIVCQSLKETFMYHEGTNLPRMLQPVIASFTGKTAKLDDLLHVLFPGLMDV